jgi:hypothetical protein
MKLYYFPVAPNPTKVLLHPGTARATLAGGHEVGTTASTMRASPHSL